MSRTPRTLVAWAALMAASLGFASTAVALQADSAAPAGPSTSGNPYQSVALKAPPGFPLSAEHQEYVDGILQYWETSSSQIQRLKCSFNRWSYDSSVCNYQDPRTGRMVAYEIAGGELQFQDPDKAYISVERKRLAVPPSAGSPELTWKDLDAAEMDLQKERYVCSGDAIYMFDFAGKQLIKQNLPPELRGNGIKGTPLPFLFGAKADDLKARYWIRPMETPPGVEKQWYLEIYPKYVQDAENYSVARIVLAGDEFMPKSVQLFSPDFNPQELRLADGGTMPAVIKYQVYEFQDHDVNFTLNKLLNLWRDAFQPRTPSGWRLVEKQMADQQAAAAGAVTR